MTPSPDDPTGGEVVSPATRWSNYIVTVTGCWEWQGHVDVNGYARIYDPERSPRTRIQWAHRAFYERHRGLIAAGNEIDHTCCNTICVNPDHLDQVTHTEHVRRTLARLGTYERHQQAALLRKLGMTYSEIADALDFAGKGSAAGAVRSAIDKGLVAPDCAPPTPYLTAAERDDIRALRSMGIPETEIGVWYGVHGSQISRICNGRTSRATRHAGTGEAA